MQQKLSHWQPYLTSHPPTKLKQDFNVCSSKLKTQYWSISDVLPSCVANVYFNKFLQRETSCIHLLCDKFDSVVNRLLGKFVKISIIRYVKDKGNLIDAHFHSHDIVNQLPDSNIFVGFLTRQIFRQLFNNWYCWVWSDKILHCCP